MAISAEHDQESRNYEEAQADIDVELWQKTMHLDIESMYSNKI